MSASQTRTFYPLPKIHKPVKLCNISEYIDSHLKPIANRHERFVKKIPTDDLLSKLLKANIPKDSFLVTLDIDLMYTNTGIDAGIKPDKKTFDMYPDSDRQVKNIIELLELSLKGNYFEFNGEMNQQMCGCAKGKRFSPHFATIYVAKWEEAGFIKSSKSPLLYLRYLDDTLIIFPHSKEELLTFFEILNLQTNQLIFLM